VLWRWAVDWGPTRGIHGCFTHGLLAASEDPGRIGAGTVARHRRRSSRGYTRQVQLVRWRTTRANTRLWRTWATMVTEAKASGLSSATSSQCAVECMRKMIDTRGS